MVFVLVPLVVAFVVWLAEVLLVAVVLEVVVFDLVPLVVALVLFDAEVALVVVLVLVELVLLEVEFSAFTLVVLT